MQDATALFYKNLFRADISLTSRSSSCRTFNLLFTTNGLHHAHGIQQKTRSDNPLDLTLSWIAHLRI
eukprot:1161191-Pelagomonas_calceolata.AAC.8